jgi:hypothetical protein
MGIRTTVTGQWNILKNKGNERTGIWEWRNDICHIPFYKGNTRMRWLRAIAYWVGLGPSWVFAPSGYLHLSPSFPSRSPVVHILSAIMDAVLLDSKSIAWTGWLNADAHRRQRWRRQKCGDDGDRNVEMTETEMWRWRRQNWRYCREDVDQCRQRGMLLAGA